MLMSQKDEDWKSPFYLEMTRPLVTLRKRVCIKWKK